MVWCGVMWWLCGVGDGVGGVVVMWWGFGDGWGGDDG